MTATTARRTTTENDIRTAVLWANGGYCVLDCGRLAGNAAHRVPEGQGGRYVPANLLAMCGSGTAGCHWSTESARELAYRCGWLLHRGTDPATTPALIATCLGADWHMIGADIRLAEPGEVPEWMWPGGFRAAVTRLRDIARGWAA